MTWFLLPFDLCEHELVVTSFLVGLTALPRTLAERPQPTKCLLEWHCLNIVELLDAGHHRYNRSETVSRSFFTMEVSSRVVPSPAYLAADFVGVVIQRLTVLHDQLVELALESSKASNLHSIGVDEPPLEAVPHLLHRRLR
jgi:hypothetical protein